MSTKLELLISDITVRSYSKYSNYCPFTRTHARGRLLRQLPRRQRSAAGQTIPRSGAASVDPHLSPASGIHDAVHCPKYSIVDRVEVGAVGRPAVRRDERWSLTTQRLNRRTCPLSWYSVLNIYHKVTIAIKCRLIDDSLYQNLLILK